MGGLLSPACGSRAYVVLSMAATFMSADSWNSSFVNGAGFRSGVEKPSGKSPFA